MIITEIKRKGKSELYYVYADGEFFSLLQAEFIVKNKLKTGTQIAREKLMQIKEESDNLTCSAYALNYLSKAIKTEFQLRQYLKKYSFSDSAINQAIEKLKNYGYLNDKYYAELLAKELSEKKGRNYIKNELNNKGIKKESYEHILEDLPPEDDACKAVTLKWLKNKPLPKDQKEKAKLYRFLSARGFAFETIKRTLSKINATLGEDDDWNWFNRSRKN